MKTEYQKERKEHPSLSSSAIKQIVKDHKRKGGENMAIKFFKTISRKGKNSVTAVHATKAKNPEAMLKARATKRGVKDLEIKKLSKSKATKMAKRAGSRYHPYETKTTSSYITRRIIKE